MNTERIVRIHGDDIDVVYSDGTKLRIGDTTAGQASDTYHSLDDLYRHRAMLTAALLHAWHSHQFNFNMHVHKSKQHADGEDPMFDGMFRVGAELPSGPVSWHYPLEYWDLFSQIPEWDRASAWDGYTSDDVLIRLQAFVQEPF